MSKAKNPPDGQSNDKDIRTDDLEAALEESEEQQGESQIIEDAEANQKEDPAEWEEQN